MKRTITSILDYLTSTPSLIVLWLLAIASLLLFSPNCFAETFNGIDFDGNVEAKYTVNEETITKYKEDKDIVGYMRTFRDRESTYDHLVWYNCKTHRQVIMLEGTETISKPSYLNPDSVGRLANDYACNVAGISTR